MLQTKNIAVFVLLLLILLSGYIFFSSSTAADQEKNIITKSEMKIVSVEKYNFGKGGLVLIAQEKSGNGILKAYTLMPVIDRYMKTTAIRFNKEDQPVRFVGESWGGYQALTYQDGKLVVKSDMSGAGFAGRIPLWIALSALTSFVILFVANYVRKRRISVVKT